MKNFRVLVQTCCLPLVVLAIGISAFAQSNKGTIVGTVKDPNDALVTGAKITAINLATGEVREAESGEDGTYTVSNLDPGGYRVSADAQGFQSVVFESVSVETSSRLPLDVKFTTVAGGTGTVTISADAVPLVESETSVRGDLITGKQVTDLPIPQRNFTLLATLSPGVTRPAVGVLGGGGNFEGGSPVGNSTESTRFRESGGSVLVVNGARPTNNNYTLDGVDNNEGQFGQIGIYPPPDSIAEFKIETSVPAAESGRAGGAVISTTTKTGTNEVHGVVYENYQGRFASAIGRNENPNNLPNRNTHQFGGAVGGPIFLPRFGEGGPSIWDGRNKSFWFFYMDRQRNATPAFSGGEFPFVTVPTARMRVGDFGELLRPGTSRNFTLANGTTVSAPRGTIFCANMLPAPSNDIRNCGQPLSQSALNTLQAYPLPTEPGLENNFRRNRKEKYNRDGWGLRFDHNISSSNSLFFAYSEDDSVRVRDNNFPPGTSPNNNDLPSGFGAGEEFGDSRGVRIGDTHIFSPTVINDFRFGATRVEIGIDNPGINGALGFNPNVSANLGHRNVNICAQCEGVVLLGVEELLNNNRDGGQLEFIGDGGPFYFTSNNFSFADGLTIIRGSHSFKFGGDYRIRQNSNFDGGRNGGMKGNVQYGTSAGGFLAGNFGNIGIGPSDSGSGIANLLFGYPPAFITRGTPGGPNFQSNKELAFFAQDDWKVNPDLTLNLGLRWDLFTQPTERFDRQTNYNPANDTLTRAGENAPGGRDLVNSDKNNFGPRFGFAWSGLKDDRTVVIRGGYGLLYAVDIPGVPGILSTNPPGGANYACNIQQYGTAACPQLPARFNFDTGYPFPQEIIGIQPGQTFAAPVGTSLVFVDPDISNEMFHQYNLTAQWEFRPNWLAELGYVGSRGRNLLVLENIGNQGAGGFPGSRQVTTRGTVQKISYTGKSWYDSLQSKLEKRFSGGLSLIASYVWSKAMDNSPGAFCIGGTGPRSCGFANPLRPELDKAVADFDTPHRFNFATTWDLPFGRGRRYWSNISPGLNAILGGWQLNNNITIQSGPPFSIFRFGVRADVVPAGSTCPEIAGQGTTTARTFEGLTFCPARARVFSSDPELDPTPQNPNRLANVPRFGNVGRNVFRGDRQEFWDAGLFKNIFIPAISERFNVQLRIQAYNVLNHVNGFRPRNDLGDSLFGIDTNEQRRRQLEFGVKIIF